MVEGIGPGDITELFTAGQSHKKIADHFHSFWHCLKIQLYLQEVIKEITATFEIECITVYLGRIPAELMNSCCFIENHIGSLVGTIWKT